MEETSVMGKLAGTYATLLAARSSKGSSKKLYANLVVDADNGWRVDFKVTSHRAGGSGFVVPGSGSVETFTDLQAAIRRYDYL